MTPDEQKSRSYVWVEPTKIPDDWSNDPDSHVVPNFQKHLGLPNPRPVLCKNSENNFLVDGGNGKYYLYNDISDNVMELYERNLDNILSILRSDAGRRGLVFRYIGCRCGPKEDPGPWQGPFPLQV